MSEPAKSLETEFDALRREIELHITERHKIESQVVVGAGAMYAWLFSLDPDRTPVLFQAGLAIPPILILVSFLRWCSIHMRTMKLGEYIQTIELDLFQRNRGWETFLRQERSRRPFWGQFEGWTEFFVWLTLFIGSLAALWLFGLLSTNAP